MLVHPVYSKLLSAIPGVGPDSVLVPHGEETLFALAATFLMTDAGNIQLAKDIPSYWAALARQGDPNIKDLPQWPPYGAEDDATLILDARVDLGGGGIRVERQLRKKVCDFWDGVYDSRYASTFMDTLMNVPSETKNISDTKASPSAVENSNVEEVASAEEIQVTDENENNNKKNGTAGKVVLGIFITAIIIAAFFVLYRISRRRRLIHKPTSFSSVISEKRASFEAFDNQIEMKGNKVMMFDEDFDDDLSDF